MAKVASKANQSQGMLVFKLTLQQNFAIGTLKVREIVPYMPTTKIPYSHHHVIGTVTIRDLTVPVIDMAAAIGFRPIQQEEYQNCYLIVTDCLRTVVAFMVRSIEKIIECDWKTIETPPSSAGHNIFVTGITRYEEKIVQMLDVELLLSKIYPQYENTKIPMLTDIERERLKALNILLVDDSSIARKQLSDALDRINIPYQICKNGTDALDLMKRDAEANRPIDLLVSDIEMPGLDGYELAFEVQNDSALNNSYRILHTSLSSEICVDRAHQVGAHEALEKFNAGELIEAMLRGAKELEAKAMAS
ncbi:MULTISPECIES: chemotaxis protein [Vibrio]|jgi:two-component system chemotaxis response regulator CheV|uniref:Chemotaxis protein CheV n=1 Tax=Vibrio campbellii TaxID=680 RepID=A0AAC9SGW3_9VIBR|nr:MULTISPECIES: chemotaxis protein [Vibrio]EDL68104.1 chemotaxis signal transduction protein [Vibrio campbellii HY01]MED5505348.1 chemotaxis protein [Pseudomonadota bacterium]APX09161.1 chemotaxis protein CheW [Vibrio campbellii]AQM71163.1 Chemotaxis protein CheV [Vibrio campbellii]ARR08542.1 chemotaxis protein CheW [Vibrio campbellii]|tara:strand:+ start:523 stop:1437 length:915 start_codon:yes stop_codon:yes gene_type:complete